jgi:hypothetical protein
VDPDGFFDEPTLKKKFVGQTGNQLVSALPRPYRDVYPIDEPPGKLIGFALKFSGGWVVELYAAELKHVERFRENLDWKVEDFLRETITDLRVHRYPDAQ